jgi:hypothetical protein
MISVGIISEPFDHARKGLVFIRIRRIISQASGYLLGYQHNLPIYTFEQVQGIYKHRAPMVKYFTKSPCPGTAICSQQQKKKNIPGQIR